MNKKMNSPSIPEKEFSSVESGKCSEEGSRSESPLVSRSTGEKTRRKNYGALDNWIKKQSGQHPFLNFFIRSLDFLTGKTFKNMTEQNSMSVDSSRPRKFNGESLSVERLTEKDPGSPRRVTWTKLFLSADRWDFFFVALGTLGAIINGGSFPLFLYVFGSMNGVLSTNNNNSGISDSSERPILAAMSFQAKLTSAIGVVVAVSSASQIAFWRASAERQTRRLRVTAFRSLLHRRMAYFDAHGAGQLCHALASGARAVRDALGDKPAIVVMSVATAIGGFALAFIESWKLTLTMLAFSPLMVFSSWAVSRFSAGLQSAEEVALGAAAAVAEEALSGVRTVRAHNAAELEESKYSAILMSTERLGVSRAFLSGIGLGADNLALYVGYALGFWYGTKLAVEERGFGDERFLRVFFGVMSGAVSVGQALPRLAEIDSCRVAAFRLFEMIEEDEQQMEKSQSSLLSSEEIEENGEYLVEFRGVSFAYPQNPELLVLDDFHLRLKLGQTLALVGCSGCGKTTALELLLRFYDPCRGSLLFEGRDVRSFDLKNLRRRMGFVSQHPALFSFSVLENVKIGDPSASNAAAVLACRLANADGFVARLPDEYDTPVGDRGGALLSGGQKQRLAIARALLRQPTLMLLDEATSALDSLSEGAVRTTLDGYAKGSDDDDKKSTIVVAHSLATVAHADAIAWMEDGKIVETGTYDSLMSDEKSRFRRMMALQKRSSALPEVADPDAPTDAGDSKSRASLSRRSSRLRRSTRLDSRFASFKLSSPRIRRRTTATSFPSASSSVDSIEDEEDLSSISRLPDVGVLDLLRLNAPEAPYLALGCLASVLIGAVQPCYAVLFARNMNLLANPPEHALREATVFALVFCAVGFADFVFHALQGFAFGVSGQALVNRVRRRFFLSALRRNAAWFDRTENSVARLTSRLTSDCALIQGLTGVRLGRFVEVTANAGLALFLALYFGWRLALFLFVTFPLLALGGYLEFRSPYEAEDDDDVSEEERKVSSVVSESIANIRTVVAFGQEDSCADDFETSLAAASTRESKRRFLHSLCFAYSQSAYLFVEAAGFVFAAWLLESGFTDYLGVVTVFAVVVFSSQSLSDALTTVPDYAEAKSAAVRVLSFLDEPGVEDSSQRPEADFAPPRPPEDKILAPAEAFSFRSVHFRYPSRERVVVLRDFDLDLPVGETLALVGASGSGKSTVAHLLERFYDIDDGVVRFLEEDVAELPLGSLRRDIAYASQEADLFAGSFRDNIVYGMVKEHDEDRLIESAKSALIHDFICGFPQGYDASVGPKGGSLSGGQRQRVALARALYRRAKLLILDEATSALDANAEARVLENVLMTAKRRRTAVLLIAHKLTTVSRADRVAVLHRGRIVEVGDHEALMAKDGMYFNLFKSQT